eukprot:556783-Prymnesium_polylepis.1
MKIQFAIFRNRQTIAGQLSAKFRTVSTNSLWGHGDWVAASCGAAVCRSVSRATTRSGPFRRADADADSDAWDADDIAQAALVPLTPSPSLETRDESIPVGASRASVVSEHSVGAGSAARG